MSQPFLAEGLLLSSGRSPVTHSRTILSCTKSAEDLRTVDTYEVDNFAIMPECSMHAHSAISGVNDKLDRQ